MTEFILELYTEEIPARLQTHICNQLENLIPFDMTIWASSCRILLWNKKFQPPKSTNLIPINAWILKILKAINLTQTMHWKQKDQCFIRPLRSILCLWQGKVVNLEYLGIKSSNITYGHKTLTHKQPLTIKSVDDYFQQLRQYYVIINPAERKAIIQSTQLEYYNSKLIDELVGIAEYPQPILIKFDKKFLLSLPQEVIVTVLNNHMKCLVVKTKQNTLANQFVAIANIPANTLIKQCYHYLVTARLKDAEFLYQLDLQTPLINKFSALVDIVYHIQLGSMQDKVWRTIQLVIILLQPLSEKIPHGIVACMLYKLDLTTYMVKEFPELQGTIGYHYINQNNFQYTLQTLNQLLLNALKDNKLTISFDQPKILSLTQADQLEIAEAVRDCYYPQGLYANLPKNTVAIFLAIADKLDTLISFWNIKQKPTGSKDPFALRRVSIGIISIIIEQKLDICLSSILSQTLQLTLETAQDLLKFIAKRTTRLLHTKYNFNEYLLQSVEHLHNPYRQVQHIWILQEWEKQPDFRQIVRAYKRLQNFLKPDQNSDQVNNLELFGDNHPKFSDSEHELYKKISTIQLIDKHYLVQPLTLYKSMLTLALAIHQFFIDFKILGDVNKYKLMSLAYYKFCQFANFSYFTEN